MKISDALLPEFDQEMANTRKTLERVPDDKFGWKPHAKSGSLGWLASHVAHVVGWGTVTVNQESVDVAPADGQGMQMPEAKNREELLSMFDKYRTECRAAIAAASDEHMMKPWTLLAGGKSIFSMPRVVVMRSFVMNHGIHHRAQLGVYLRLLDIPVPAIYGPSADEGQM